MKSTKKYLLLFLILIWSSYAVWEWQVEKWARINDEHNMIRVDLILILPILIGVTAYVSYILFKANKKLKQ